MGMILLTKIGKGQQIVTMNYRSCAYLAHIADSTIYSDDHDTYSAYFLAQCFGIVEILNMRTNILDLRFPASDQVFSKILGRIQGIIAADVAALANIQPSESFFKNAPGIKTHHHPYHDLCSTRHCDSLNITDSFL